MPSTASPPPVHIKAQTHNFSIFLMLVLVQEGDNGIMRRRG
jgi:hypothetical protein